MLYLIRHTAVSVSKNICYGQSNVPLSATFEGEAEAIRLQVSGISMQKIYSSPLSRCTQLATLLFGENSFKCDDRLQEMNFGDWEMQDWDDIHHSTTGKKWFDNFTTHCCPNGESFEQMTNRVREFYYEIAAESKNKNIAICTHAGVLRSFMCVLEGELPEATFDREIDYGQILQYDTTTLGKS